MMRDYRDGVSRAQYGAPDDWGAERRAMQEQRPLTGLEALVRITEFRAVFGSEDDDDE
jgi:hypothetical protein